METYISVAKVIGKESLLKNLAVYSSVHRYTSNKHAKFAQSKFIFRIRHNLYLNTNSPGWLSRKYTSPCASHSRLLFKTVINFPITGLQEQLLLRAVSQKLTAP